MRMWFVGLWLCISCGNQAIRSSGTQQIFTGDKRRDPTDEELSYVLKTESRCTAFWVKNDTRSYLVAVARHCYDFKLTDACDKKTQFYSATGDLVAQCKRLIAARVDRDIAIVEVEIKKNDHARRTLSLASKTPPGNTPLKMIGFPTDSERKGMPTTTEGCFTRGHEPFVVRPSEPAMLDEGTYHNCSTWGGNSGGPMILDGTSVVLGMPFTYSREHGPDKKLDSKSMDGSSLAKIALMTQFVREHSEVLTNFKVAVE